jgi:hypothetical protein
MLEEQGDAAEQEDTEQEDTEEVDTEEVVVFVILVSSLCFKIFWMCDRKYILLFSYSNITSIS